MEAIGQLTGGIAHDFNNMLTVLIGNLQLLQQAPKDPASATRLIDAAMDASMRAADLVKRLLAFSRRQMLVPKTTDINELIVEIQPLIERTITADIGLNVRLADDLWLAKIDQCQLESTLLNLANNARDALHSGGRLTIETSNVVLDDAYAKQHSEVTPGQYVMIAVADNGEGISKEVLPHVFDPFFSTKEVGKGTGLGLSMVYGFVKQSNGHIKVYSEEGHGTTIKIYVPWLPPSEVGRVEHTIRTNAIPGGDECILLVEDDDSVRETGNYLLTSLGYKVLQSNCGDQALRLLDGHDNIDLLFTDLVMPGGITGMELAKRARARNPNLKVLYTSGYSEAMIFDTGLLAPGSEVLNKPYIQEQLANCVRDALDRE